MRSKFSRKQHGLLLIVTNASPQNSDKEKDGHAYKRTKSDLYFETSAKDILKISFKKCFAEFPASTIFSLLKCVETEIVKNHTEQAHVISTGDLTLGVFSKHFTKQYAPPAYHYSTNILVAMMISNWRLHTSTNPRAAISYISLMLIFKLMFSHTLLNVWRNLIAVDRKIEPFFEVSRDFQKTGRKSISSLSTPFPPQ